MPFDSMSCTSVLQCIPDLEVARSNLADADIRFRGEHTTVNVAHDT